LAVCVTAAARRDSPPLSPKAPVVERERRVAGCGKSAKQPVKPLVAHTGKTRAEDDGRYLAVASAR
jgi:hypothetical protein